MNRASFTAGKPAVFDWAGGSFRYDGEPVQLFSGEMHYPRIPDAYWRHRFQMARAAGLNVVCTYVFWNAHQPDEHGGFDFSGNLDVAAFIQQAGEAGLFVIVRPGPYVCSEWDLGGLPAWLLAKPDIRLRCMDEQYLAAVGAYIEALAGQIRDLQCTRGGPVVMLQVENEYGSYGSDKEYLAWLCDAWRKHGIEIPFFTSDGASDWHLDRGTCLDQHVLETINLGSRLEQGFDRLQAWRARAGRPLDAPCMIGEYWNGWFAHWGAEYPMNENIAREERARAIEEDLRWMRDTGKSISLYMFHGGTNFGFWAGANHYLHQGYKCDITSYDNTAPVNEHGAPTVKFDVLRRVLGDGTGLPPVPPTPPVIALPEMNAWEIAPLFDNLDSSQVRSHRCPQVKSMEAFGQAHGLILYRHHLIQATGGMSLTIHDARDTAHVFLDGKRVVVQDHTVLGGSSVGIEKIDAFEGSIIKDGEETCIETRITGTNPIAYPVPVSELLEDHVGKRASITIIEGDAPRVVDPVPPAITLPDLPPAGARLDILIENNGRVNYGMAMQDERKGITRKVVVDPAVLMGWEIFPLPLDEAYLRSLKWCEGDPPAGHAPAFYRTFFDVAEPGDTFLDTRAWQKGFAWVNGHNLGRFWSVGPQQTLYLPGPWLRPGRNELVVFSIDGVSGPVRGLASPIWNELQPGSWPPGPGP